MIPVTDALRSRTLPLVNITLILACVAVFVYELTLTAVNLGIFVYDWGVIPASLIGWWENPSGVEEPATVFTSMFIHGGWLHLLGNMLYLWVFGDNVEDALGHTVYALFYLASGVGAVALQTFTDQDGIIPMVGASGAIAGVLGAYLVTYPRATVGVVIPWLWFLGALPVPAFLLIAFWFMLQVFNGVAAIGPDTQASAGIAFWAHVGGFVTGLSLALVLRPFSHEPRRYRRRRS